MTRLPFASTKDLLVKAQKGKYAVGHFNINNMEIVQGVVQAANSLKSPIILATSEGALLYAGMDYLFTLAKTAAKNSSIPISLHLDHGKDLSTIKKAIDIGYSSVMFDGSHLPFEENVKLTRLIVKLAHAKGVFVEAELGTIGGSEDLVSSRKIIYTDPKLAYEFVKQTRCDFLAIGIGTSHGAYKFEGKTKLRYDLLKKIKELVKIPLVLHGASGVNPSLVKQINRYGGKCKSAHGVSAPALSLAIKDGICKVNTDTDLRLAFDAALRKRVATNPSDFDPRHILGPVRLQIQKIAEERIKLFGSVRKA